MCSSFDFPILVHYYYYYETYSIRAIIINKIIEQIFKLSFKFEVYYEYALY